MHIEKIQQNTAPRVPELIMQALVKAIEDGHIRVGEELPSERDLAEMLGVGRGSLRECLAILEFLGAIDGRGNRKVLLRDADYIQKARTWIECSNEMGGTEPFNEFRRVIEVGIVGLGVSGRMIADALAFLGADISYYSRSRKPDAEAAGMKYKPLDALLRDSEVVFTCLNKNVLLLGRPEFEALGEGKVLFNTSIGPGFDSAALEAWLDKPGTHFFCDTYAAAGPVSEGFFARPNVHSPGVSAGRTKQAFVLLSEKVLANLKKALDGSEETLQRL